MHYTPNRAAVAAAKTDSLNIFLWSIVGNLLSDCACAGGLKGLGGVLICKMRYQQAAVEGENGEREMENSSLLLRTIFMWAYQLLRIR
jgi:hypothetical protein